ncbi:hypothetical protein HEK616_67920 [Streptomyces nigrescens]|uniref:Secreted protein n=2 Tax=Streptomyces TaxID=1883 RepID=A0ABM8A3T5_STRNI|nr:hypothetical protein [Streptomyces nigrescens]MEE4425410.1 hypothetical protein [Streptomyces sp. DSM 41528]BDM73305.1 hypothetical protein HEK616_67920 [Streptomyces nigrescens]
MRRRTTTTLASASAAVLCLGVLLTGCGDAADRGHVAVGAAGPGDGAAPQHPVPPRDGIELTPYDGNGDGPDGGRAGGGSGGSSNSARGNGSGGSPSGPTSAGSGSSTTAPGAHRPGGGSGEGPPGGQEIPSPGSHGTPTPTPRPTDPTRPPHHDSPASPEPGIPAGPGAPGGLLVGHPVLAGTDVRWCQKVSLDFVNTGDHPVTTGKVTFGSHVIGPLGVDWATLTSTHEVPLPLAPGTKETGSWRVCVDAWRVPLGMHLDTRDFSFAWGA